MLLFLKNLVFTLVVPGTVAVYIPIRIATGPTGFSTVSWVWEQFLAFPPLLLGAATYLRCVWDFATAGEGTPAPIDAPRRLVVRGLYRNVRNPMYVGVLLVVGGWALFFRSLAVLWYGCALGLVFHLFVVVFEEPHLRRRFGEPYERYCRAVGRWIPGRGYGGRMERRFATRTP